MAKAQTPADALRGRLEAERKALLPALAVDLDRLREAARAAAAAESEYRRTVRPQYATAPDPRTTALSAAASQAAGALRVATEASERASRRTREIDRLLNAARDAEHASAALAATREAGELAERRIAIADATAANLTADLGDAERNARGQAEAFAARAMAGEPATVGKADTGREAAAARMAFEAVQRQRDAAAQQLRDIAAQAADARKRLLRARLAQAEIGYAVAMTDLAPAVAALVAAQRMCGDYSELDPPTPDEAMVANAIQELDREAVAWKPMRQEPDATIEPAREAA